MKRALAITAAALGLAWLVATGVLLFYVADLLGVPWLLGAFVVMDGAFLVAVALLIETNTRRAWPVDPFGLATDELFQRGVQLPSGTVFGRREDDRPVVEKLSEILEAEAAKRPISERTPWWLEERRGQAQDETPVEERER